MTDKKDEKEQAKKPVPVGSDILSESKKRDLREQAQATAREEAEKEAADKFLKEETEKARSAEKARRGEHDQLDFVKHRIDLGPSADHIRINNMVYQHGAEYTLRRDVYNSIRDIEAQTWKHEKVRKGDQDENAYRLSGRKSISAKGARGGSVRA